jgi:glutamate dehydrogenase
MGVEVVDERPYSLDGLERPSYIYDFGLRYTRELPAGSRELFQDAVKAVWEGHNEVDGFNALVLAAGLTWRQATLLRAYAKYMRQGGTPFAQDYIEDALAQNVDITRLLVTLFETRFDPGREDNIPADSEARVAKTETVVERIKRALDDVASLDQDRILRSYLTVISATLRTNYFQYDASGRSKPYISVKLQPDAIPDLPQPRPKFEIFVYSPRVEGVHLRFGAVARGGLRWSDRRDDFRTEVLGLVKAQMVKNTVIVPVGAKGGFFCKQLPDPGNREAWLAEGVACYKTFICGLLDITDNLRRSEGTNSRTGGETIPPERVVRHDGDDSYLVVAADKGTATFSDIANGWPRTTGSGSVTRSPRAGRSATTTRRWASPPAAPGSRCAATSARWGWTARPRTSPASASATCPATCSATACCSPSTSGWWRPSTTATSSSTPTRTRRRRTPSASGSSSCPVRAGRTTTPA